MKKGVICNRLLHNHQQHTGLSWEMKISTFFRFSAEFESWKVDDSNGNFKSFLGFPYF
jgi:hypothetical protein